MTPEATALAERLARTGAYVRNLETALSMQDGHHYIDLDHPSNEGHLRVLAEEVCGAWVQRWATTDGISWRVHGEGILMDSNYLSPGQAYAAAIVAHYEGEKA